MKLFPALLIGMRLNWSLGRLVSIVFFCIFEIDENETHDVHIILSLDVSNIAITIILLINININYGIHRTVLTVVRHVRSRSTNPIPILQWLLMMVLPLTLEFYPPRNMKMIPSSSVRMRNGSSSLTLNLQYVTLNRLSNVIMGLLQMGRHVRKLVMVFVAPEMTSWLIQP